MGARSENAPAHSRRQSRALVRIRLGHHVATSEHRVNRREFVAGLATLPALVRSARAEVSSIRLGKQYGLPFLPQMVMEDHKMIEAHGAPRHQRSVGDLADHGRPWRAERRSL